MVIVTGWPYRVGSEGDAVVGKVDADVDAVVDEDAVVGEGRYPCC